MPEPALKARSVRSTRRYVKRFTQELLSENLSIQVPKTKNGARDPDSICIESLIIGRRNKKSHRRATLPPKKLAVPSPKQGLTSVFGMGTGVALAL